jgi:hypothetical protein
VVTNSLDARERDRGRYEELEGALRDWGIRAVHMRRMHEKLVLIDAHILWQGSLNPLSFSSTQEIMERRDSRQIASDYARVLRLDELLSAYRADETICPYCGHEVVAAEGRDEPFYWPSTTASPARSATQCLSTDASSVAPAAGRLSSAGRTRRRFGAAPRITGIASRSRAVTSACPKCARSSRRASLGGSTTASNRTDSQPLTNATDASTLSPPYRMFSARFAELAPCV